MILKTTGQEPNTTHTAPKQPREQLELELDQTELTPDQFEQPTEHSQMHDIGHYLDVLPNDSVKYQLLKHKNLVPGNPPFQTNSKEYHVHLNQKHLDRPMRCLFYFTKWIILCPMCFICERV